MSAPIRCFVVEDDRAYASVLRYQLERISSLRVDVFSRGETALAELNGDVHLVVLDLIMAGQGGLETLRQLRERRPDLAILVLSAQLDVSVAVEAVRLGAYDYITKGQDDLHKVQRVAEHVAERYRLRSELACLRARFDDGTNAALLGESPAMQKVYVLVDKAIQNDSVYVGLSGEPGTGKELTARTIHYAGPRRAHPFLTLACAVAPDEGLEVALFGLERGPDDQPQPGLLEQAAEGTLVLDEIAELGRPTQNRLLAALREGSFVRIGGRTRQTLTARLIATSTRDAETLVREGLVREELVDRVFDLSIPLPPLRERANDAVLLAEQFRRGYLERHPDLAPRPFSTPAKRVVLDHAWPGNVKALKNAVERALLLADGPAIEVTDLITPDDADAHGRTHRGVRPLEDVKRDAVAEALRVFNGNIQRAAQALGITRSTLYRYMERFELEGRSVS